MMRNPFWLTSTAPAPSAMVAYMAYVRRNFVDIYRSRSSPSPKRTSAGLQNSISSRKKPEVRHLMSGSNFAALMPSSLRRPGDMAGHTTHHDLEKSSARSGHPLRLDLHRTPATLPQSRHSEIGQQRRRARNMRHLLGTDNDPFVGPEAGGKAAAIAYTLIETARLNAVDPHGWLADTLARIQY